MKQKKPTSSHRLREILVIKKKKSKTWPLCDAIKKIAQNRNINPSSDNCLDNIELSCGIKIFVWSHLELCKFQFEYGKNSKKLNIYYGKNLGNVFL